MIINTASAGPVDLSAPSGGLGAANMYGYLSIWRQVDDVGLQLDKDSYLPLRYEFSSDSKVSGILGPGFYCPMFEAKNVLIREQMMRAFLPCGKGLYLRRNVVDPNKFQTVDGEWIGYLNGDDFTIWRDDGWKLVYHQNRLSSLTSDENHIFTWSYSNGMPSSVSEDNHEIITVEPNVAGQVAAFIFNGKRYEVAYAERPLTQVLMGQVAIKEIDQALSSFGYPDGKSDTFKFTLTPDRVPTLTFTDRDGQSTLYSWDTATDYLVTEKGTQGDWTYKVGEITQDFGLPPISKIGIDGKMEGVTVDTKMGIFTTQGTDGVTTVKHVFETPGPLYGKIQKIEQISGKTTSLVYRASYDEAGRLIREMDDKGFSKCYTYDDAGKLIGKSLLKTKNSQILADFKKQEANLLSAVTAAQDSETRQLALENLAIFYIDQVKDTSKALALASQFTDKDKLYLIKRITVNHDDSLSYKQKIAGYIQLEKEFPEKKADLDYVIQKSQMMVDAGLY